MPLASADPLMAEQLIEAVGTLNVDAVTGQKLYNVGITRRGQLMVTGVAKQEMYDGAGPIELLLHEIRLQPVSLAGALHQGAAWRRFTPMKSKIPTTPLLPMTAISVEAPSSTTYNDERIEVAGKCT